LLETEDSSVITDDADVYWTRNLPDIIGITKSKESNGCPKTIEDSRQISKTCIPLGIFRRVSGMGEERSFCDGFFLFYLFLFFFFFFVY